QPGGESARAGRALGRGVTDAAACGPTLAGGRPMTGWQLAAVGCSVLSVAVAFVLWAPATYRLVERGPWWLVVLAPAAPLAVAVLLAGRAGDIDPYIAYPLAGLLAVAGGNPIARTILAAARRADPFGVPPRPAPETVLRGGAWIGALERIAITVGVLVGSMEL